MSGGDLTADEIAVALRNIGIGIECGRCVGLFYTGHAIGACECGFVKHAELTVTGKCFCCTCPEKYGQSDPYCRNHGHAGVRECVKHRSADTNQGIAEGGSPLATCQQVWDAKSWIKADNALRTAEVSP